MNNENNKNLFTYILIRWVLFDTKSRIWKNQNQGLSSNENFKEFETLSNVNETFYEIIELRNSYKFRSFQTVENNLWFDKFYNGSNQLENFQYKD